MSEYSIRRLRCSESRKHVEETLHKTFLDFCKLLPFFPTSLVSTNEFHRGTHACTQAIQCIFRDWKIDLEYFAYLLAFLLL